MLNHGAPRFTKAMLLPGATSLVRLLILSVIVTVPIAMTARTAMHAHRPATIKDLLLGWRQRIVEGLQGRLLRRQIGQPLL